MKRLKIRYRLVENLPDNPEDAGVELVRRLDTALRYATDVIEGYEMDARRVNEKYERGFCQGRIYREARNTIVEILAGTKYREGL